jgi:hypothetical protein
MDAQRFTKVVIIATLKHWRSVGEMIFGETINHERKSKALASERISYEGGQLCFLLMDIAIC